MAVSLPPREQLAALFELSRRFNSERDLTRLLELVAKEAARLLAAERASLFLLEDGGAVLTSYAATGSDAPIRFDARLGVAGEVVSSGRPVVVNDAYSDARFYSGVDEETGFRTRSLAAVPIQGGDGEIMGAFEVMNKLEGHFTPEDVALLEMLATNAGMAIQNATLIAELNKSRKTLENENRTLIRELSGRPPAHALKGSSPPFVELREMIARVAESDVSVLITGESGTGKDLVARSIHLASARSRGPMVALNCAALPETLVETELFGVEKGVATGVDRRAGKFELAEGGTLFLDEIGDLSLTAQAKILRVLQSKSVERVGGRRSLPVDVRIVAATNKDLEGEIRKGSFREDLYYRLNVVRLRTPALRTVPDDIPLLAKHFLTTAALELKLPERQFTPAAIDLIRSYQWPGNVRQLENEMRRVCVLARGTAIEPSDLSEEIRNRTPAVVVTDRSVSATLVSAPEPEVKRALPRGPARSLQDEVEELERRRISEALASHQHNQLRTAKALGLSRQGLINKLKRYGIGPAGSREE